MGYEILSTWEKLFLEDRVCFLQEAGNKLRAENKEKYHKRIFNIYNESKILISKLEKSKEARRARLRYVD